MSRIFDEPTAVFSDRMLKPELQGLEDYVDGIKNITEAQQKVALNYFEDGSIEAAIPPLKILLHIMAYGNYEGKEISDSELRKYFDRDYVVNSDWYKERLKLKQEKDIAFFTKQIQYLEDFISNPFNTNIANELNIQDRLTQVKQRLEEVSSKEYLNLLEGTIGVDPLCRK